VKEPVRVLTRRELNRALLERQLLLERSPLSVARAVERLGGLQAQSTPSPYLSLWTRLEHFERGELTKALNARRVVKALLLRGTLHVVVPKHYWALMAVRGELASTLWPASYEARIQSTEIQRIAKELLRELTERELTLKEAQQLLAPYARDGVPPTFLWRRIQSYAPVIHVAPSGIWGYGGHGVYAAAQGKVRGGPPAFEDALDEIVAAYLRAYGPASAQDFGQWAGIPRLAPIKEALGRLSLRTFRDEAGKLLYDLPRAPLPDPETPAAPRLVPRFDNLVLAHADRSRILGDVQPSRIVTKNGLVHATIVVDGFVAGTWQIESGRVVLEPWSKLDGAARRALKEEAGRLEAFAA
jgi:Winged helix DNA-binding domain